MRRMAEINEARSEACSNEGANNPQNCITPEESASTNHRPDISCIEEPDSSGKPASRSKVALKSRCDLKYFSEEALTPSDVDYSDGARDLIQRLLNPDPQRRLRSLLSLQNIRFFKDFDIANVRTKKISPKEVLLRHYPDGPNPQQSNDSIAYFFEDFDSIHI